MPKGARIPRLMRVRMVHLGSGSGRQAARLRQRGDVRSSAAVADVTVAKTVAATSASPMGRRTSAATSGGAGARDVPSANTPNTEHPGRQAADAPHRVSPAANGSVTDSGQSSYNWQ